MCRWRTCDEVAETHTWISPQYCNGFSHSFLSSKFRLKPLPLLSAEADRTHSYTAQLWADRVLEEGAYILFLRPSFDCVSLFMSVW